MDLNKLKEQAAATGTDHTKMNQGGGGGDYTPPAAGPVLLRFVGYVELGEREDEFQGKKKTKRPVILTFECFGKNYPPREGQNGEKWPITIEMEENLSFSDRSNWPKLFAKLNYAGTATHPVQLLGEAFRATIYHKKWPRKGEDRSKPETWTGVDAVLRNPQDGSYSFSAPQREVYDEETGEVTGVAQIKVPVHTVPVKAFLWNNPDMEQWESIYIDGEWPERKDKDGKVIAPAKSKNKWQMAIRAAKNYPGSPINHLLANAGKELDLVDMSDPDGDEDPAPPTTPAADPLAGASKGKAKGPAFDDDIPF